MYCFCILYVCNMYQKVKHANSVQNTFSCSSNTDPKAYQCIQNSGPVHILANKFTNTIWKWKKWWLRIQSKHSGTVTIVFITCTSTCLYKHWYCQITRPRQNSQHSLLPVCQRYLSLPSSIRPGQQDQPRPLDRRQTVPQCFVTVKLSSKFPRRSEIPECRLGGMPVTLHDVLGISR